MDRLIVCVGNRFVPEDALGPAVYDHLARGPLPPSVTLVDGGLRGVDLLAIIEGAAHVVFVDAVAGLGAPDEIVELGDDAAASIAPTGLGHGDGLRYLLAALPHVVEGRPPRWALVGAAGPPTGPLVEELAARALALSARAEGGSP